MKEIILEKRYPHSREEDITDAFMRGYEIGKEQEHRWWSAFCANCKTEPQTDCYMCKWLGEVDVCGRCRNRNLFAEADTEPKPKTEPTVDKDINVRSKDEPPCDTCKYDINEDDYDLYDMCKPMVEGECRYEPQTERSE